MRSNNEQRPFVLTRAFFAGSQRFGKFTAFMLFSFAGSSRFSKSLQHSCCSAAVRRGLIVYTLGSHIYTFEYLVMYPSLMNVCVFVLGIIYAIIPSTFFRYSSV